MANDLRKLSQAELCQIRAWHDDLLEDEIAFMPEFEAAIERSERDMAEGKPTRVRERLGNSERLRGQTAPPRSIRLIRG